MLQNMSQRIYSQLLSQRLVTVTNASLLNSFSNYFLHLINILIKYNETVKERMYNFLEYI